MRKHTLKHLTIAAATSALLVACDQAGTESSKISPLSETTTVETLVFADAAAIRKSAKEVATRSVAWQFDHMDEASILKYIPHAQKNKKILDPLEWIQGTFYVGAARWSDTIGDTSIVEKISNIARQEEYALGPRPMHGDDHLIGQTYLWLHDKTGDKATYSKVQTTFDSILENPPTNSLEFFEDKRRGFEGTCQDRWCWADALFMAPRTWMQLSKATGDMKYFDYANKEYWATADYLFSEEYGLFFRDSRYFDKKSDNGEPVFWGRGNGWVFAAMPLIIEEIPEGHKARKKYLKLFTTMAKALVKIQRPDGFWSASLMDPGKVKTPETSGSAFINFGLAWGVNNGVLSDKATTKAVEKGWAALASVVDEDGMVHWVQQIGKSPDPVKESDTQFYGVGAVLLAASEMTKWGLAAE